MVHFVRLRRTHAPYGLPTIPSNNAEPIRTIVEPSSMATSKSALMPIESSRRRIRFGHLEVSRSRSSRSAAKSLRARSGPPSRDAIVISPSTYTRGRLAICGNSGSISSGRKPCLAASPETFISSSTSAGTRSDSASLLISSSSRRLSAEWITGHRGSVRRTLFLWRWPTRCQVGLKSASAAAFCHNSCGRLSPKCVRPAPTRSLATAGSTYFVTPTSSISPGCRPARVAARSIRWRTWSRFSRKRPSVLASAEVMQALYRGCQDSRASTSWLK
jgi:hypothetical protein